MRLIFDPLMPYIPYIGGLAAAAIAYLAFSWAMNNIRLRGAADRLERFVQVEGTPEVGVEIGSEVFKIRLAFASIGLDVTDRESLALWVARAALAALLTLGIWFTGFPPLTLVAGPLIAWFLVASLVEGAWGRMRRDIESEIPTFLSRMSGTVQAEPNVLTALEEVGETLNPEGPLQIWLRRLVSRISAGGQPAFRIMLDEAETISPSLGLAVFEVGRLWETGGEGYAKAFARASENLMGILEGRVQAYAKAAGAKSAIRVVLGALVLVSVFMLRNPALSTAMRSPLVQVTYLIIAVWVAIGWFQINSMVEEAVE